MKLQKLLKDLPGIEVHGSKSVEITGISNHSKLVSPGNLFIALKGQSDDGSLYIPEAVQAGAAAVVTDIFDPTFKQVTQVICDSPALLQGVFASRLNGQPDRKLFTLGVTGTKGKTTTTYLIQHFLQEMGKECGLMGTIETKMGSHSYPSSLTTADVVTNFRMLAEMVQRGMDACVLEVSSHALDQGRVDEISFDCTLLTNLSPDHLDYHGTLEEYYGAKAKLFQRGAEMQIANCDCPRWDKVAAKATCTYGMAETADVRAEAIVSQASGTTFTLRYQGSAVAMATTLVGKHNVYNILAAAAVALSAGAELSKLPGYLQTFGNVPGRLERVPNERGLNLFVDFAHNGPALEQLLSSLKSFTKGKLIVLFGCGGDRDRTRREGMARAAGCYADLAIVTTDNPRQEDPEAIIDEILSHFPQGSRTMRISDRKEAIERAVALAQPEDIVVLAGRGHEKMQILASQTVEFDDLEVARDACSAVASV